jgi:hypothetical protein
VAHRIDVAAGRCTLVMATGGMGLGRIALRVVDEASGAVLAERNARQSTASARVCSTTRRRASVQIVARLGTGTYALHTSTRTRPIAVPAEAGIEESGAILDAIEEAASGGWPARGTTAFTAVELEGESATGREVPIAAGECVRVAVIGSGGEGASVEATLRREGRTLARGVGRAVDLRACGIAAGTPASVEVRNVSGVTRVWLGVFARPRRDAAP